VVELDAAMKAETQLFPDVPESLRRWPGPVPSEDNEREVDKSSRKRRTWRACASSISAWCGLDGTRGAPRNTNKAMTVHLHACSQSATRCAPGSIHHGRAERKTPVTTADVARLGMKTTCYPEYIAVLVAARKVGRPVHWQSTRSEPFVSDAASPRRHHDAELALDGKGKFLALRVRHLCNQAPMLPMPASTSNTNNFARCLPGMYRIAKVDVGDRLLFHQQGADRAFRGAGRPEANYALERVVEEAARVTGIDPVKLRKKNLIPQSAMPFKTPINTYDSGDFPGIVDKALKLADFDNFNSASAKPPSARSCAASACRACSNTLAPCRRRWRRSVSRR